MLLNGGPMTMTWLSSDGGGRPVPPDPVAPAGRGRVTIEVEARPGTTTIVVKGELDLVTMPFLAAQLARAVRDRPARLVFDLGGTRFLDCASARLIAGAGAWLPGGGRPVIRRPGPRVRRIFELTGLDAHCEIEPLVAGSIPAWRFAQSENSRERTDERLDTGCAPCAE
jgi:anti-anti-sigma factor